MNIIVSGSRDHDNPEQIFDILSILFQEWCDDSPRGEVFRVIQGGARGADSHAFEWCVRRNRASYFMAMDCVESVTLKADWSKHGPSAGPRRNIEMLTQYPDAIVLGFPQGASKGTRQCIREAEKRGMQVRIYESEKNDV